VRSGGGEFKEAAAHMRPAEREGHSVSFGQRTIAAVAVDLQHPRTRRDEQSAAQPCGLTGLDPHAYLAKTITKIVEGHATADELLPWVYPAATALKHVA
jgi:hypothetical protein